MDSPTPSKPHLRRPRKPPRSISDTVSETSTRGTARRTDHISGTQDAILRAMSACKSKHTPTTTATSTTTTTPTGEQENTRQEEIKRQEELWYQLQQLKEQEQGLQRRIEEELLLQNGVQGVEIIQQLSPVSPPPLQAETQTQQPPSEEQDLPVPSWTCELCAKTMSLRAQHTHLAGKPHAKKVAEQQKQKQKAPTPLTVAPEEFQRWKNTVISSGRIQPMQAAPTARGGGRWKCEVCAKEMGLGVKASHLAGKPHAKMVEDLEEERRRVEVDGVEEAEMRLKQEEEEIRRQEGLWYQLQQLKEQELLLQKRIEEEQLQNRVQGVTTLHPASTPPLVALTEIQPPPSEEADPPAPPWTCDLCAKTMSLRAQPNHLAGKPHAKKVAEQRRQQKSPIPLTAAAEGGDFQRWRDAVINSGRIQSVPPAPVGRGGERWKCEVCAKEMGLGVKASHLAGKPHAKMVEDLEEERRRPAVDGVDEANLRLEQEEKRKAQEEEETQREVERRVEELRREEAERRAEEERRWEDERKRMEDEARKAMEEAEQRWKQEREKQEQLQREREELKRVEARKAVEEERKRAEEERRKREEAERVRVEEELRVAAELKKTQEAERQRKKEEELRVAAELKKTQEAEQQREKEEQERMEKQLQKQQADAEAALKQAKTAFQSWKESVAVVKPPDPVQAPHMDSRWECALCKRTMNLSSRAPHLAGKSHREEAERWEEEECRRLDEEEAQFLRAAEAQERRTLEVLRRAEEMRMVERQSREELRKAEEVRTVDVLREAEKVRIREARRAKEELRRIEIRQRAEEEKQESPNLQISTQPAQFPDHPREPLPLPGTDDKLTQLQQDLIRKVELETAANSRNPPLAVSSYSQLEVQEVKHTQEQILNQGFTTQPEPLPQEPQPQLLLPLSLPDTEKMTQLQQGLILRAELETAARSRNPGLPISTYSHLTPIPPLGNSLDTVSDAVLQAMRLEHLQFLEMQLGGVDMPAVRAEEEEYAVS